MKQDEVQLSFFAGRMLHFVVDWGLPLSFTQVTGPTAVSLLDPLHPVKCRTEEDFTGQEFIEFVGLRRQSRVESRQSRVKKAVRGKEARTEQL